MIDYLQKREPFGEAARKLFQAAASEMFSGYITAKSATDIYYLAHQYTHSDKESRLMLDRLFEFIGMLDTTADDILQALSSNLSDFEDAVMVETAVRCNMQCIITRNIKDYNKSPISAITPSEFIEYLFQDIDLI